MIRLSTSELYQTALTNILNQQSQVNNYYRQLSTGSKINTPADNPVGAAQVIGLDAAVQRFDKWSQNAQNAQNTLNYESSQLQSATTLLGRVRTLALQMANGTMSQQDRLNGASTAQSYLKQLLAIANSQNANGQYIFAGTRNSAAPFAVSGSSNQVAYYGDSGQRNLPISASENLPISDSGQALFMNVPNGNGTFSVTSESSNTGTATVTGNVTDANTAQQYLTKGGDSYRVSFSGSGTNLTYSVVRGKGAVGSSSWNSSKTTVATGSYTPGSALNFNGISLSFQGTPASGDAFDVSPSQNQSLFQTVATLKNVLGSPANTPGEKAQNLQVINNVLQSLDQGSTHLNSAQAAVGTRIQSAQTAEQINQTIQTQFQKNQSQLQNANLPQVITQLDQASTALQAASKAFVQVQGLSLFNFIS